MTDTKMLVGVASGQIGPVGVGEPCTKAEMPARSRPWVDICRSGRQPTLVMAAAAVSGGEPTMREGEPAGDRPRFHGVTPTVGIGGGQPTALGAAPEPG